MYCTKCGRRLPDGSNDCAYCSNANQNQTTEPNSTVRQCQYMVEYVKNGFFFGGAKKWKIEQVMNSYAKHGWRVVSTTYHQSTFLLIFPRCGTIITFIKEL